MKRMIGLMLLVVLLFSAATVCAQTDRLMSITQKSYNLEVRNVDLFIRQISSGEVRILRDVDRTGLKENTREITLEYDYEKQEKEFVSKFEENAPIALVTVHGFDEKLAVLDEDEVVIAVNGKPLKVEKSNDLYEYIGWEDVLRDNSYGVVFPIELTKQGGIYDYTVSVLGVAEGVKITETAQIRVKLVNTHEYKDEKQCRIVNVECEDAEVYIVGEKLYVDHPVGKKRDVEIKVTFADEKGEPFTCITWAEGTVCKKEKEQAALYLEKDVRLDKNGKAVYQLESGSAQERCEEVQLVLETKEALYKTQEYGIVERFDVVKEEPKGIYFAQKEKELRVGDVFEPVVLGVKNGEVLRSGVFGKLSIAAGENTDAKVIDATDGKTVIAVKPGVAYITARYETALAVYDAASMKITVRAKENAAKEYTVLCRRLNVRAGAGLEEAVIGKLQRGENVRVVAVENGWAQLAGGGYVCAQYIG